MREGRDGGRSVDNRSSRQARVDGSWALWTGDQRRADDLCRCVGQWGDVSSKRFDSE